MKNLREVFDHCDGYVMEDYNLKDKYFRYEFGMSDFGYLEDMKEETTNVLQVVEINGKKVAILENIYEVTFNTNELYDGLKTALNEF